MIEEAYELLKNDQVDAIVYDAPVLQYYVATSNDGRLIVVGDTFKREDYGIALPPNSAYEEEINKALLEISLNGRGDEIYRRWFISEDGQ
jgi:polar amino acid transport system substrate-binding protein